MSGNILHSVNWAISHGIAVAPKTSFLKGLLSHKQSALVLSLTVFPASLSFFFSSLLSSFFISS